jgi:formylglycine-generating enzyme required for sulfatase activity
MRWGEKWVGWGLLMVVLAGLSLPPPVDAAGRMALVIGNSSYAERPLKNPPNDARAMTALLRKLGFTVTEKTDLTLAGFRQQVNAFLDQSKGADLRLFYYSGHGASYDGDNYLLPIGHGVTRKHELPDQAYSLKTLLRGLKDQGGINLVLLDSCRDAPFGDAKSIWDDSKGMRPIQPQEGVLIGYAAQNGRTASDNSGGGNSLYTKYLLQELGQSLELREALMRVRQGVYDESRGEQRPTTEDEVLGKVHLAEASPAPRDPPPVTTGTLVIRNSQPPGAAISVDGNRLGVAPQTATLKAGQHTIEAKQTGYVDYRDTVQVRAGEQTTLNVVLTAIPREPAPVVATPAPVERPRKAFEPEMVRIKGGCFQMGSPKSEPDRNDNERQHEVCVKGFEMGRYEVTQRQWQAVMGSNPSEFSGCADCPVEQVSWNDIQHYLRTLNQQTDKKYRLPTEAEWEYACRGGAAGEQHCGGSSLDLDQVAWYNGGTIHPVGQKAANGFSLYDMSGNVWEWTCSAYDKDYGGAEKECNKENTGNPLSVRGGSWRDDSTGVRSAYRAYPDPADRVNDLGFRLARSL